MGSAPMPAMASYRPPLCRQGPAGLQPLIAHVGRSTPRDAGRPSRGQKLDAAFWPGPLTLVLPKQAERRRRFALAGLDSVAVRVPAHPVARLCRGVRRPGSGAVGQPFRPISPTSAAHVLADLRGRIDMVIDSGPARSALSQRSSPASARRLCCVRAASGGPRIEHGARTRARRGCRRRRKPRWHRGCSPRTTPPRRGCGSTPRRRAGEALLAFGPAPAFAGLTFNLSPRGDLIEAAANLFSHLRALDASGVQRIAVMKVPHEGLGEAINDRLKRAAAPKTE